MADAVCFLLVSFLVISFCISVDSFIPCFDKSVKVKSIPNTHLYARKEKPLVIGHHGNPSEFQENTIDGFNSLKALKADGMEFDTFLTKDNQLVVFHYDNTLKLTGQSHDIWNTTYADLQKLDIKSNLTYGSKFLVFGTTRKIPLLSDVIDAVKDEELVMYLNMKPGYLRNRTESESVGKAVAQLIAAKGVINKVLLSSFDPFKILAAKKANPSLVVGTFYKKGMWDRNTADAMKNQFGDLPGMRQCMGSAPNGTKFMDFLFETGDLPKSTNSTYVVMDYNIYNNPKFSNNTFQTFKDNYNPELSFGAFIIDNLVLTDEQRTNDDKILDLLIHKGASAFVTDDIPRLRKKLGRTDQPTAKPTAKPTSKASTNKAAVLFFTISLLGLLLHY